jgi:osmotically-inducible protein OsmY
MPFRTPRSYDEIVRRTVPNPDSSWRPSSDEEQRALNGWRAPTPEDKALCDDIHDALIAGGIDASAVKVEADCEHVVVRGVVHDRACAERIVEIIDRVPGVRAVVDQLTW